MVPFSWWLSKYMQELGYQNSIVNKRSRIYTKKHHQTMEALEILLEAGVPELTMSEIAKKLKISLRTLYEIAPSKDQLILMTMDNILRKLGKHALDSVSSNDSPIKSVNDLEYINAIDAKFIKSWKKQTLKVQELLKNL